MPKEMDTKNNQMGNEESIYFTLKYLYVSELDCGHCLAMESSLTIPALSVNSRILPLVFPKNISLLLNLYLSSNHYNRLMQGIMTRDFLSCNENSWVF